MVEIVPPSGTPWGKAFTSLSTASPKQAKSTIVIIFEILVALVGR
jgi:hypothetical protein